MPSSGNARESPSNTADVALPNAPGAPLGAATAVMRLPSLMVVVPVYVLLAASVSGPLPPLTSAREPPDSPIAPDTFNEPPWTTTRVSPVIVIEPVKALAPDWFWIAPAAPPTPLPATVNCSVTARSAVLYSNRSVVPL